MHIVCIPDLYTASLDANTMAKANYCTTMAAASQPAGSPSSSWARTTFEVCGYPLCDIHLTPLAWVIFVALDRDLTGSMSLNNGWASVPALGFLHEYRMGYWCRACSCLRYIFCMQHGQFPMMIVFQLGAVSAGPGSPQRYGVSRPRG